MKSIYSYRTNEEPEWPIVREIRTRIYSAINTENKTIAMAAAMTASELAENAIKYGKPEIGIVCEVDTDWITVSVSNEIDQNDDVINLRNHINRIKSTDNPLDLYLKAILKVMEQQGYQSRLGLFRIAGEAEFILDCAQVHNRVTVYARRRIANPC